MGPNSWRGAGTRRNRGPTLARAENNTAIWRGTRANRRDGRQKKKGAKPWGPTQKTKIRGHAPGDAVCQLEFVFGAGPPLLVAFAMTGTNRGRQGRRPLGSQAGWGGCSQAVGSCPRLPHSTPRLAIRLSAGGPSEGGMGLGRNPAWGQRWGVQPWAGGVWGLKGGQG